MPHWKSMMQKDYIVSFELKGKDVTVTIERVTGGTVNNQGKKSKKPLCYFREARDGRPLVLNATNCKTIAKMYGTDTDGWVGKRITLYPTTTEMGGDTVECIRVRNRVPDAKTQSGSIEPPAAEEPSGLAESDPEPGSNG